MPHNVLSDCKYQYMVHGCKWDVVFAGRNFKVTFES